MCECLYRNIAIGEVVELFISVNGFAFIYRKFHAPCIRTINNNQQKNHHKYRFPFPHIYINDDDDDNDGDKTEKYEPEFMLIINWKIISQP